MKEKVMVFEIKDKTYIALSQSGEFLERPITKSISVGDYLFIETRQNSNVREFKKKRTYNLYPLLKVAAVILIAISLVFVMSDNVSIIATIDINPSFEFHLNNEDEIVKAVPLSPQAEDIADYMEFKGLNYQQGLTNLVEESINQGYIKQTEQNLIVVSMFDKDGKDVDLDKKNVASEIVERISKEKHLDLVVATYDVSEEEYKEAKNEKTSVNKIVASKKASELGLDINREDLNKRNIKDLAKEQGISPGLLISEKASINQIEAAPPGLTKKDVLPPGHQKKEAESEKDQSEDIKNFSQTTPAAFNDKDIGEKPEDLSDKNSDKKDKPKVSNEQSDNKKNEKRPDNPPGQSKKGELEDEEEINVNEEKDLPPGLENKDKLAKDAKDNKNVPKEQLESENAKRSESQRKTPPGLDRKDSLEADHEEFSDNSKGKNPPNSSDKGKKKTTN